MGSWGQEPVEPAAQEQSLTGGPQLSLLLMENSIGVLQESRQEGEEGEEFLTNPETSVSWKIPSLSIFHPVLWTFNEIICQSEVIICIWLLQSYPLYSLLTCY